MVDTDMKREGREGRAARFRRAQPADIKRLSRRMGKKSDLEWRARPC